MADIVRDFRYKMEREREEQETKLRAAHDHFIAQGEVLRQQWIAGAATFNRELEQKAAAFERELDRIVARKGFASRNVLRRPASQS